MEKGIQRGMEEGMEKGMQSGLEKGMEKGREEELHQTLLSFVQVRFPDLDSFAKQQTATINDREVLHNLLVTLFGAQTSDEAKQVLIEVGKHK